MESNQPEHGHSSTRQAGTNSYLSVRAVIEFTKTYELLEDIFSRHFGRFGLSQPKFTALMHLRHAGEQGLPLSELGQKMTVSRANITGLVDRLEKDGLVRREQDPTDRRILRAQITTRAMQLLEGMLPIHNKFVQQFMNVLTLQEKEQLLTLLGKLQQAWDEF